MLSENVMVERHNCLQDQDQDSLLVKRRNDNHSPGPVIRELVPSSHQRSELSNTILCIYITGERAGGGAPYVIFQQITHGNTVSES